MNKFDELVNDYTLMGDTGAVIFSSYDKFLEFVEEIRVDETAKRKTLAELLSATPEVVAVSENGIRTVKQTPKKEWVGLTEEEIFQAYKPEMEGMPFNKPTLAVIAGYIEAKLKEKNT